MQTAGALKCIKVVAPKCTVIFHIYYHHTVAVPRNVFKEAVKVTISL